MYVCMSMFVCLQEQHTLKSEEPQLCNKVFPSGWHFTAM